MYHNKRKGTDLRRITVECLFCNLKLNRENFETHRKRHHKSDPKCQYAIVNDGKQSKLNFGKSSKGEEEDVNVPQPHTEPEPGGGLESGSDTDQQQQQLALQADQDEDMESDSITFTNNPATPGRGSAPPPPSSSASSTKQSAVRCVRCQAAREGVHHI